tara:strand:- start:719 stop:1117 length:399 start_codon:yes stop_codon:yes gene_type:complete
MCVVSFFFFSCEKEAGEGGTSVVEGQIWELFTFQNPTTGDWDTTFYRLDPGKDVYIIYSDDQNQVYDDKFETDYNGKYRFEFLRKGDYTVYTYADSTDVNMVEYDFPIFKKISITSNNSTVLVDDFIIEKNQ